MRASLDIFANARDLLLRRILDLEDAVAVIHREIERDALSAHPHGHGTHAFELLGSTFGMDLKGRRDADPVADLGDTEVTGDDLVVGDLVPVGAVGQDHHIVNLEPGTDGVAHVQLEQRIVATKHILKLASMNRHAISPGAADALVDDIRARHPIDVVE
jgi:hypothetical protein